MPIRAISAFKASSFLIVLLGYTGTGLAQGTTGHTKEAAQSRLETPVAATASDAAIDQLIPPIRIEGLPISSPITLSLLRKHEGGGNPLGNDFSYPRAFATLNFEQVKADIKSLMKESREFWPADYGHYGPFFIRLAWHSAGTYRAADGRGGSDGGQMRFYPLANWPDNANLDKARRLLQPIVDKYYPKLSWADAMVLAGDLAIQDMGFKTLGVAGGRADDWAPDMVYWGPEDAFLKSQRFDANGKLMLPLAASVMGLIYVNPEGPDGKPDPLLSAERIRTTFGRMGMNDEETVALIAGGHTFGKTHGAPRPATCKDPKADCPAAKGANANTSGLEGSWTANPTQWTHDYLTNLYRYEWELVKGPGGKFQWYPKNIDPADLAPDAHDPSKRVTITMLTTDLALRYDPAYKVITTRFLNNPDEFGDAFARAWFKLIHRDLGPKSRYLGSDFPKTDFIWQDPVPVAMGSLVDAADVRSLKRDILSSGLTISDGVKTAWAAAASYRGTDMRGGVNGARVRLEPQKNWEVNEPQLLSRNLGILQAIQTKFNMAASAASKSKSVSLADLIVLAGNTSVEQAAKRAGVDLELPFVPGRTDASQAQTETKSFEFLKVTEDGFRNYYSANDSYLKPLQGFINRADFLTLTKNEMVVLTGGLRVLGANYENSKLGVFTNKPETLTNDFFVNLLDHSTSWSTSSQASGIYVGRDSNTGAKKWIATQQDLILGANPELRMVSFSYATSSAKRKFVADFAKAWTKVMNLDRFDKKAY